MYAQLKRVSMEHTWFGMALILLALFLVFTVIFSMGVLIYPTLYVEQWLLHRPLTGVDCSFRTWRNLGTVQFGLFFTLILGIGCLLLRYRWRVLPYLFLLFLLGVGVEYVGKQEFPQPVPNKIRDGMASLFCPQLDHQPNSLRLRIALGMWWKAPAVDPDSVEAEQRGATALFTIKGADPNYGYPSGHAMRWSFIGLLACWLFWRHVKYRVLRTLLVLLALAAAFGGGFILFYIGGHLITDLVAGYLVGASSACCAIALLLHNEKKDRTGDTPDPGREASPPAPPKHLRVKADPA